MKKFKDFLVGGEAMMINYFAMQVQLGWITLEQVPKRYREKVRELVEMSEIGVTEDGK
ncbi:hypothetical protein K6V76_07470 [Streptococcus suis]|nr:hypothetical protein [Streptococcus suis]